MWTLINLYETENHKTPDLIPKVWVIDYQTCWYPMSFKLTTIKSLSKEKAEPNINEWEKFKIQIVENDINDYDYGIQLMYKLLKNISYTNLHSDAKKRGRGMMKKIKIEDPHDIDSDSDNYESPRKSVIQKSKTQLQFPHFPKKKKESHRYLDAVSENTSASCKTISTDPGPSQIILMNAFNSASMQYELTPSRVNVISDDIPSVNQGLITKCKLTKTPHACSFESSSGDNNSSEDEKYQLLISVGHQLCRLSADFQKFKSHMSYFKHELTSFIEERGNLNSTFNKDIQEDLLSMFPIKNEEQLLAIETKLLSDELAEYNNKLLSALMFAAEGKSISKVTNSLLKTLFTDEFATHYSWKGQKEKKKLENFKIFKVIIYCIGKKFPNSDNYKTDTITSIMNWFAQAPTRIMRDIDKKKKKSCKKPAGQSDEASDKETSSIIT